MAQTSYPYDAGAGAAVNEAQWQAMARRFRQTGVIGGSLNQLAVTADGSSLAVSVASGDAFVEGFFYRNDAALALTIATANATNPRIDTVVVRLDRTANTATLAVITGTSAASPVGPTLSQTDSLYELPLANVTVPAAAGVIVAGNLADRRTITQTFDSAAYVARAEAVSAVVAASESTTSTAYVDLATVGPTVTATIASSGRALVILTSQLGNNTTGAASLMSVSATGLAADDSRALFLLAASTAVVQDGKSLVFVATGLTPGALAFTAKFRVTAGGGTFTHRRLTIIPL